MRDSRVVVALVAVGVLLVCLVGAWLLGVLNPGPTASGA